MSKPIPFTTLTPLDSREAKIAFITARFEEILDALGLDRTNPSIKKTPQRIAESYVNELFRGLEAEDFPGLTYFEEPSLAGSDGIVRIDGIEVTSTCEHHFMPILGAAKVAYRPNTRVLGLSKVHRLVDHFARRPQLQERLTAQIADSLSSVLETPDVAVEITAWHGCVSCRGVQNRQSQTTTTVCRGLFEEKNPFI